MPQPDTEPPKSMSDPQLAIAVREGRAEALAELYLRHADALLASAYRLLGSVADAEDVLHDLFVGLPDALRRYEERGNLLPWLRLITIRLALRTIRRDAQRRETDVHDLDQLHAAAVVEQPDATLALRAAVQHLPATLRAVVLLKFVEGYTHAEIGTLLEISAGASEVRLVRAMKHLRATLGAPQ